MSVALAFLSPEMDGEKGPTDRERKDSEELLERSAEYILNDDDDEDEVEMSGGGSGGDIGVFVFISSPVVMFFIGI